MIDLNKYVYDMQALEPVANLARKNLRLDSTKGKVVCFSSSWERGINQLIPSDRGSYDEDFILNERRIFKQIREIFLAQGHLSFLVIKSYRESKKETYGFDVPPINDYFKIKKTLSEKANELIIIPETPNFKKNFKLLKIIKIEKVKILVIDYSHYWGSVLSSFLEFSEHKNKLNKDGSLSERKTVLEDFFKTLPFDVRAETYFEISNIIKEISRNSLSLNNFDDLEFFSNNHLQNIQQPYFWNSVNKDGIYCESNKKNWKIEIKNKKTDIRFFYSFTSLLFYEITQSLKITKRCANCGKLLPKTSNVKYCSILNKKCWDGRNRKKQDKHYKKNQSLTKT